MMAEIKIHVFHTGEVCVAPELPFGGEGCSIIKSLWRICKEIGAAVSAGVGLPYRVRPREDPL